LRHDGWLARLNEVPHAPVAAQPLVELFTQFPRQGIERFWFFRCPNVNARDGCPVISARWCGQRFDAEPT